MKISKLYILIISIVLLISCTREDMPIDILQKTINTIDTVETVYYKQNLVRTNPRNLSEIISRYREMYFKKLADDTIVGAKGHWYFYKNGKFISEDIYDGNKLIRKNNRDSLARVYDLIKYPKFKEKHFWGHRTPYSMQYVLKDILKNKQYYDISRLSDTIIKNIDCFQIKVLIKNKGSIMPGFSFKLVDMQGSVSTTTFIINKLNYYPICIKSVDYSMENVNQKYFMEQTYFDININVPFDEHDRFNTSRDLLKGFKIREIEP